MLKLHQLSVMSIYLTYGRFSQNAMDECSKKKFYHM